MLMSPMRDGRTDERTASEYRATQLLICEPLSLAILVTTNTNVNCDANDDDDSQNVR